MNHAERIIPTPAQEQAAYAWLSLLHDHPSSGDQVTFSHWLQADPAHAEAYAQAQVVWELSEAPARTLAAEDALALQGYLDAMNRSGQDPVRRWAGGLAVAACLLLMVGMSVTDVSQKAVANLGWSEIKMTHPLFVGDTLVAESEVLLSRLSDKPLHYSRG